MHSMRDFERHTPRGLRVEPRESWLSSALKKSMKVAAKQPAHPDRQKKKTLLNGEISEKPNVRRVVSRFVAALQV